MDRIRFIKLSRTAVLLGLLLSGLLSVEGFYKAAFFLQIPILLLSEISAWFYFRTPRSRRGEIFRNEGTRMYTSALHPYYLLVLMLATHILSLFWMLAQ